MRELIEHVFLREAGHVREDEDFFDVMDKEERTGGGWRWLDSVRRAAHSTGAIALVLFVNEQMDSSHCGESQTLCVGPTCTYKSPEECEGKWLKDLPSQRQYAVAFCRLKEPGVLETKKQ